MATWIRLRKGGREVVTGPVTRKEYLFMPQHAITAALVDDEDVPKILLIKKKCCGETGRGKPKFELLVGRYLQLWNGEIERI